MILLMLLNLWLLCRLVFIAHERPLPTNTITIAILVLLLVAPLLSVSLMMLGITLLLAVSLLASERWLPEPHLNLWRLLMLMVLLLPLLLLRPDLPPGPLVIWLIEWLPLDAAQMLKAQWSLLGLLLVANEVNLLIRALFHHFNLEPMQAPLPDATSEEEPMPVIDQREYNAGRIIGILERWLIYTVLIAAQNYNVIAFILAAKGFARFRQLEEREFAEYVLIGTLASTLLTLIVSELVMQALAG